MLAALVALQAATFLGGQSDRGEAEAAVAAVTDYCLPIASGGASGPKPSFVAAGDPSARLRFPLDTVVPRYWRGAQAMAVPSRNGTVWVVAFEDGRCLVRAWGNVLTPVSQAVHALFDAAPWQRTGDTRWTASFTQPGKKPAAARGVIARFVGEQVDSVDVQGDAAILLTPQTPIGEDNGFTFRTRHP